MTLPGDSLNHVHIRSEAFCFGCVRGALCVNLCAFADPRGGVVFHFVDERVKYFHYVRAQTSRL